MIGPFLLGGKLCLFCGKGWGPASWIPGDHIVLAYWGPNRTSWQVRKQYFMEWLWPSG